MSEPSIRPDPDVLLARVARERAAQQRGRLKIFFGASAGVGKTYAMLEAARKQKTEGVDVVVGYVELHGRAETEALLDGLEVLPAQRLDYKGIVLREFDLDAALARRPRLVAVDELAHTNHPGARHPKRWHDIEELLEAGIDVYTTVNVQHIESLNDIVAQITGVQVQETIPDSVFDAADEVELIDLPPDDLLQRLREGRVYGGEKSARAMEGFFRKGNLIALRQLALRATADRVDAALRDYREHHAIARNWSGGERLLVCVGPDELSERVVRAARRQAAALYAPWVAVYVETPRLTRLDETARDRVLATLKLAESLGAETANLSGESVAAELIGFARTRNVSKILVGKPLRPRWRDRLRPGLVDELIRLSGTIDVYVVSGEAGEARPPAPRLPPRVTPWQGYLAGAAVVALATLVAFAVAPHVERTNLVMVYLLAMVLVAVRWGRGPSVLAAVLGVLLFDFLFVPPFRSFAVSDSQYLFTFAVMLAVGLTISNLTAQGRRQARVARERERRTAQLYALSREMVRRREREDVAKILRRHVLANLEGEALVLFADADEHVQDPTGFCRRDGQAAAGAEVRYPVPGNDLGIAQWAYDHQERAGLGTDTLASADAVYLPLRAPQRCLGVLGLRPADPRQLAIPEQVHLIEAMVNQAAVALERIELAQSAQSASVAMESEKLRNLLLSAISHDFRTPLATIVGAASTLLESAPGQLDDERRRALLQGLQDEALRMTRLVGNLLDLSRLSAGAVSLQREWVALEELVGAVLHRLAPHLEGRRVSLDVPRDLPLLSCDEVMIEQLFANLVENALKHTPPGTPLEIAARAENGALAVRVRDHGPGLPPGEAERLFEKFQRGRMESAQSGFGLGLTICRAIVEAHGGHIAARTHPDGGAEFCVTLPLAAAAPA